MFSDPASSSPLTSSQFGLLLPSVEHSSPASSIGSSSEISALATPPPRPRAGGANFLKVNWSLWSRQEWAKWPGFERYTGGQDTRAWWQQYGYRVEDCSASRAGNRLKWICADCFARGFKKKSDFCFVCSTGASIKKHLSTVHGIHSPKEITARGSSLTHSQTIERFLGADAGNPNDQFLISNLRGQFNAKGLRVLLLDWVTYHNLPFEIVNTERFQRILLYGNPLLDRMLTPSAKTLFRTLESEYRGAVGPVTEALHRARSQIHFSFDGWTSNSHVSFLGINAQFVDSDFVQHRVLLGLRPLSGQHTGACLAEEVADTLAFWQINDLDKIGYFTLDNAASNNTCIRELALEFGFCAEERRIRCACHVIGLGVRAMLYGSRRHDFAEIVAADGDNEEEEEEKVDEAINEVLDAELNDGDARDDNAVGGQYDDFTSSHPAPDEINCATFSEYSRNGAPGMLHNIGVQLRGSSQLYEQFLQSQRKESGKDSTLHWVFNNATRWDSDKRMMERALHLRPALNTFFNDVQNRWEAEGACEKTRPAVLQYRLSGYDWKVIETLVNLLKPFEIATRQLQGSGVPGGRSTCGSFDEYFPVFEMLLDHLESAIEGTIYEETEDPETQKTIDIEFATYEGLDNKTRRLFKVFIKLGWKKLYKYYALLTSGAYAGAVVFNPAKKWRLLDQLWSRVPTRKAQGWRAGYEEKLLQIWEEQYRGRNVEHIDMNANEETSMDYIERRLKRTAASSTTTLLPSSASSQRRPSRRAKQTAVEVSTDDEYARYCAEDIVNSQYYRTRPVDWWKTNAYRYPRLSIMAVDMLSIPSSAAESERTFSSAGLMTAPLRSRLARGVVAMAQCIRSWSKAGLYTPSLPLFSLGDREWVEVLSTLEGDSSI